MDPAAAWMMNPVISPFAPVLSSVHPVSTAPVPDPSTLNALNTKSPAAVVVIAPELKAVLTPTPLLVPSPVIVVGPPDTS
jgi:hypothetical protein